MAVIIVVPSASHRPKAILSDCSGRRVMVLFSEAGILLDPVTIGTVESILGRGQTDAIL